MSDEVFGTISSGIEKLRLGNPEEAGTTFLEASRICRRRMMLRVVGQEEYALLKETGYAMESAVLYYLALALKKKEKADDLSYLAYLSYASGISGVLDVVIMPLLRRFAVRYGTQSEVVLFDRTISTLETQINQLMSSVIDTLTGAERRKAQSKVDDTVRRMLSIVSQGARNSQIRDLAVRLARKFPAGDFKQVRRLYEFARDEIGYIRDPLGVEELQTPDKTLELQSGDCDDKAILLSSMLVAIGYEAALLVADVDNDGSPDHVYVAAYLPEAPEYCKPFPRKHLPSGKDYHNWVPLDPTYEDSDFGVIPIADLEVFHFVPIPVCDEPIGTEK